MYPTHAVSTTTTIKSSLHKIHSCAYCTYANQAYYSQLRMLLSDNQKTIRRWASTKCTPVYITHQMNAQRARLRPTYYSLATAGGANKIHSSTWVLSDTNRLATVQPHSAVHEQTASLQPHPKGLPIFLGQIRTACPARERHDGRRMALRGCAEKLQSGVSTSKTVGR